VLNKPLAWLLLEQDQGAELDQFVANALTDLREVGLVDAIDDEMRRRGAEI